MSVWLFKSTSRVSGLSGNSSSSRLIAMRFRIETGSSTASWKWVTGTNKETSVRSRADLPFPPASSGSLPVNTWFLISLISLRQSSRTWHGMAWHGTCVIWWFQVMTNCGLMCLLIHLIQGVLDCTGPLKLWNPLWLCSWRVVGDLKGSLLEQPAEFFPLWAGRGARLVMAQSCLHTATNLITGFRSRCGWGTDRVWLL